MNNKENIQRHELQLPVNSLKGIGEARLKLFHKLGIYSLGDLLFHFPREYEDRRNLKSIIQLVDGEEASVEGIVVSAVEERRIRRGLTIYKVYFRDDTGKLIATWFNQSFLKRTFQIGDGYILFGKVNRKFSNIELVNPVYEKAEVRDKKQTCRIVPMYPSTGGLQQNAIRGAIYNVLQLVEGKLDEYIPARFVEKYKLYGIQNAIKNIHFPESKDAFDASRYRLVFEELFMLQLGLFMLKNTLEDDNRGIAFKKVEEVGQFIENLPFRLTNAQKNVFAEIEKDMESDKVMNRLVQGDVGSGKTIVAVLALFKAVRSGYQGAMMVPTEILAEQHYNSLISTLEKYGIRVALLTGSLSKKQKDDVLFNIRNGVVDVVVGTHALLEEPVEFERLGLVVTDEQHRFGVRQRAIFSKKGANPDVIVMTATPIPRTLALILYGDLDISIINELPPGRKSIETYVVDEEKRERINQFIIKQVNEGRQVYIVCPLVEKSDEGIEELELKSAVEYSERLTEKVFPGLRVGLIHGKMRPVEKDDVMKRFSSGNMDILVSTTVIEVGVNVPNATVMIVENAERFGLAQLHQLRGRVGRGEHQSYCILFNQGNSKVNRERMKVLRETNDGFIISEKDLELRGPGEFFGIRQHGLPELKITNLSTDMGILKLAQEAALEISREDRYLQKPEYGLLRRKMKDKLFGRMDEMSFN